MEKLQKALQKARDQRTAVGAAAVPAARGAPVSTKADMPIEAAWAELAPMELDQKRLDKNLLVSLKADQKATPFDILRTKTQLLMQKNNWSRLGITSPTPACGKTTLACNLALGLSRQTDIRAIMIELDLRRPSMARLFGKSPNHDVTAMLSGQVPFADQAVRIGENVAISMAQRPLSDPTSVLLSQRTHAAIAEIEERYAPDLIIVDLPPILVGDDTRAFLREIDCAILVAKAEATSMAQIDSCEREVAEYSNVLGVVLNQCRHIDDEGYDGYYYG